MRLNLGCGRAQLPTTPDNPFTEHLVRYLPESAYYAEWVNIDRIDQAGVDELIDLFTYPWVKSSDGLPFEDNSVEEILCSHVLEHVPHDAKWHGIHPPTAIHRRAGNQDGFYGFFYEVWRVLKPGGLIHIIVPYAFSDAGVIDPTHRRYLTAASFSYLKGNHNAPFDHQLGMSFEAVAEPMLYFPTEVYVDVGEGEDPTRALAAMLKYVNMIREVHVVLRTVK